MENSENNPEISKEREKNELDYHAWLKDIYNEIRNVHLKATCFHGNVLKLMDKFIDYFRIYLRKNPPDKSKTMHDFYLARATSRIILLFRDLITEENDHEYLLRICELLGGSTVLWIRYYSYRDQESGEAHIESILNSYAFYLQSTTDESFLLKIFAHVLFANKKLPEIFSTILEKFLIMRVQRQGRRDQETKEDQLYILYIIAFKQWEILRRQNVGITDIPKYANDFMKPMISILSNHRYAPYLPAITPNDIEEGKATRIILRKFQMRYLSRLAEATIKQDWLRGSDINTPITVDLSIEDDVNQSELLEVNRVDSVNREVENLSINETNVTISKELWWVQILQKKAMKNLKNRTNNYKVVEVIEIDDKEDDEICETVNDTPTLSTAVEDTQSKTELQKDTENRMQSEIVNKQDGAKMHEEEFQVSIPAETNVEIQSEPIEQEMNDGENVSTSEESINKTEEELIGNAGTCSNQPDKYEKMGTKQSKKKDENLIDTSTGSFNRSILKVYKGPTSSKSKTSNLIELPTNPITLENSEIDLEKGDLDEIPKEIVKTNDNKLIDSIENNSEIPSVISEEIPSVISEQTLKDTHKKNNQEEVTDTIFNARNEVSINDEILDKLDEESVIDKKGEDERQNSENKKEARTKNKNKTGKQEVMDKSKSIIEEKMDIAIENRVTSKENSAENISTFVSRSEELHSPISSTLPEDNEKCDNSNLTTNEQNNELLEISSADIERHIQNRDNDEEEIGKTIEDFASDENINLTANIPRNVSVPNSNTLTELEQDSSEDEEAVSIICIEETKLRSPINFPERNVSKTQTEIIADEINIEHNLIIDHLETSKSTKTKVYEKKHQNKNKEFSEHQVSNKNEYIPFKNTDITEKESERNDATIQRAEAETTIPPQSLEDDDRSSISSIVESETYEIIDPKTDDIHIEKIKPIKIAETGNRKKPIQENSIFSIATDKKLSSCTNFEDKFPEESAQSNRVIFSTSTVHSRKKRSISPEYSFSPIRDSFESIHGEMDEIKSPSVESFSKSDTDEFKKLFNNTYKDSLQADDESCTEEEEEEEYSMANSCFLNSPTISKRTNKVVPKPSILCKKESISTTVKRKAVSFAPIPQHKKSPLMANRSVNFDSTIIERKTYDSPLTIETEPQIWKSSINTTSISNQHDQSTNEHELDNILSTSDINCFGSPSPSLIKDSVSKISTSFPNRVVKKPAASNKLLEHGFWSGRKSPPPGGKNSSFNGQTKQQVNNHNGSQQLNKNNNRNHQEDKKIMVLKNEKNTLHNSKPLFNKEIINKTPTKRNIDLEVLKKISSIQINRSESMSDFDRYLQERKRGSFNVAKRDWTFYYLNSSPYLITNKFNSNCESHSKASGHHGKDDDTKLTEINIKKDKNEVKNSNENDLKLINSFNDPQLKKKAVVELIMLKEKDFTTPPRTSNHNNNNINIEQTEDHCDKNTLPESLPSSVLNIEMMKDIQSKSSTMTMMTTTTTTTTKITTTTEQQNTTTKLMEDNNSINNIITTDENKKFLSTQFRSPSKPKKDDYLAKAFEQNTILKTFLKDRCTDIVFGSKSSSSVVVRKRRSSVDSEIVVRVFTDKNKKHSNSDINGTSSPPNPLVLLKRMRDNDVYKNIKKKIREHSSHKRNIDELPDNINNHNEKKKKRITLPNGKRNRGLKSKSTSTIYQENCTNSNIQSWTNRNKPNIQIIDKISSPLNDRLYSKLELKKKSETKSKSDEVPDAIEDKIYFKEIHHPRIGNSSSFENKQKILNIKEESENETSKQNITQNPSLEETLGNANNETENIHPVNDFSVHGSPANSSMLTETFGSPTSSTSGKTDDSKSLNDSSKSNYSCSRLEEVSDIESNSVTLENTSNEFSMTSQSCNNIFVPDKEFNSTQENVSENESPLLILSDPRDGLLISDQTKKIKSKQRKKMVKDTLDLAILPKRRKILDSLDSNATSNGEENGNAIISITEASTIEGESLKRKQCTQESEENDEQNSRIGLPVINENNSLNIAAIPGTESPEINVNMEIGKTYSKDNLVQNVFVPPELEMNFEDVSKAQKATTHFKRKGLSKSPVVV